MKRKKIAILVSGEYKKQPTKDDLLLQNELQNRGYLADITVWSDTSTDFSEYDLAIIRSCWDYDSRLTEFLRQMKKIENSSLLYNPLDIIEKNSDKRYLLDLQTTGIKITPTVTADNLNNISIPPEWKKVVIKPNVSASGKDTYRYSIDEEEKIKAACSDIIEKGKLPLIQKYISSIETFGEHSSIVIDGKITLTVKKTPAKGGFLIHKHFGGSSTSVQTSEKEKSFIRNILSKLESLPLYMRVDYLKDENDNFLLLELEQIEPHLYLTESVSGLEALTDGIIKRLS
ncbi:ATP-grasp domain-containing protein [Treponema pedis]|uniref:ATP-grasp domain-containing protein n=1 Tax=Treponema pedis str. T A4 TaxID=1291379 RepID=S5ZW83_9SPIR|nr:hypothetical protein [Treponema pedis]AGT44600.1 hypothetical protein TPE_2126 [Treponema pedis str. T A4]